MIRTTTVRASCVRDRELAQERGARPVRERQVLLPRLPRLQEAHQAAVAGAEAAVEQVPPHVHVHRAERVVEQVHVGRRVRRARERDARLPVTESQSRARE